MYSLVLFAVLNFFPQVQSFPQQDPVVRSVYRSVSEPAGIPDRPPVVGVGDIEQTAGLEHSSGPVVTSLQPSRNSSTAPKSTTITVKFNTAMSMTSINNSTVFVHGSYTGRRTGAIANANDSGFVFDPAVDFSPGELVHVYLTRGITSSSGDSLSKGYQWRFSVAPTAGSGVFTRDSVYSGFTYPGVLSAADLDEDNDLDLSVGSQTGNYISVLRNAGDGTIISRQDHATGNNPAIHYPADLDNDGDVDIASSNVYSNNISVLLNDGTGGFVRTDYAIDGGNGNYDITGNDLDGDGEIDLVVSGSNSGKVHILFNAGAGVFGAQSSYSSGNTQGVATSDVDNDGDADFLVVNFGGSSTLAIYKNDGDGVFTKSGEISFTTYAYHIATGDVNDDGNDDMVVSHGATGATIHVNDGTGAYTQTGTISVWGHRVNLLRLADITGDGALDVVLGTGDSDSIYTFTNNGTGNFGSRRGWHVGTNDSHHITAGDFDQNGSIDVAHSTNSIPDVVSIFLNTGFAPPPTSMIRGSKYFDADSNGVRDNGEQGIPNWRIRLRKNSVLTDSTLTDGSGNYQFGNLLPGTYSVEEANVAGWTQTSPPGGHHAGITIDTTVVTINGKDFGNHRKSGISGMKYQDVNGDGVRDTVTDPGIASWVIRLNLNNVQIDSTTTDGSGNYTFAGLNPGTYVVSEQLQSGWLQTYPGGSGTHTVVLSMSDVTGRDFGNYQPPANSITVRKFRDGDGAIGTLDHTGKSWHLRLLIKDSTGTFVVVKDTNSSILTVVNPEAGQYIAQEADSLGWTHLGIRRNDTLFSISTNADTINYISGHHTIDFINAVKPPSFTVRKYKDLDGNFATKDWVAKSWQLYLFRSPIPFPLTPTLTYPESLVYHNPPAGTYRAVEADSTFTGWQVLGAVLDDLHSGPAPNGEVRDIIVGAGETHTLDFINAAPNTITIRKFADQDGSFLTVGDRTPKAWSLSLYRNSVAPANLVASTGSNTSLVVNHLPGGTYIAVEADSQTWSPISVMIDGVSQGGTAVRQWTLAVLTGQSRTVDFVNFDQRRKKFWKATVNCDWNNGGNWDPPGVPIPMDSIIVPEGVPCPLVFPPGASIGSLALLSVASQETVVLSSGSLTLNGNMVIHGTLAVPPDSSPTIAVSGNWVNAGTTFHPGKSTIRFLGVSPKTVDATTFHNLQIESEASITTTGTLTVHNTLTLHGTIRAEGDTVVVLNTAPGAIAGTGNILSGATKRMIATGSTAAYRFESPQTYIKFNGAGTYPPAVTMTAYPDTSPPPAPDGWEVAPSSVDTVGNVVIAGNVEKFSRWGIGKPTAQSPAPLIRRFYWISAPGGSNFTAELSLRYDQSELPAGYDEDSLALMRSIESSSGAVSPGWNIVSVPLVVDDFRKSAIFPTATSSSFAFSNGYVKRDTLENGVGYWVKFGVAQDIPLSGIQRNADTLEVEEDWNLIGSLSSPIPRSSIQPIPPVNITSQVFGFKGSYYVTDSLRPFAGYWIKVSQAGQVVLASPSSSAGVTQASGVPNGCRTITITDRAARSQSLYLCEVDGVQSGMHPELPPPPPERSFDVRFRSGTYIGSFRGGTTERFDITVIGAEYPLTVHWAGFGGGSPAVLQIGDETVTLSGRGSFQSAFMQGIMGDDPEGGITLYLIQGVGNPIPAEYALAQNYPNPFNPTTIIRYQLPIRSIAELAIYDVLGRKVAGLLDGVEEAGYKQLSWSAVHTTGIPVAAGVYYYALRAQATDGSGRNFTQTRKLMVIR